MQKDLILRFIGLDLLSNIARGVANAIKNLSNASHSSTGRAMADLQRQMALQDLAWQQKSQGIARNLENMQRTRAAEQELYDFEQGIRQRDMANMADKIALQEQVVAATKDGTLARQRAEQQLQNYEVQLADMEDRNAQASIRRDEQIAASTAQAARMRENAITQYAQREEQVAQQNVRMQQLEEQAARENAQAQMSSGMMIAAGGALVLGVTTAVAAGLVMAAHSAADFDSQIVLLHTHADMATNQLGIVKTAILAMAPAVGQTATEIAKAFYLVQSATTSLPKQMQDVAAKLDIMNQAARLAAIGHANLSDTTNALVDVLDVYGKAIDPVTHKLYTASSAAGVLNTTVGEGKMRLQDLAQAFAGGLLPVAQQAGVSLQSLGAAIGTLTDEGVPATRAATYLRSALIQMTMPSGPAVKALQGIGVATSDVQTQMAGFSSVLTKAGITQTEVATKLQSSGSLGQTLDWLSGKLQAAGLNSQQAGALLERAFGGIRSGTGVVSLTNNLDALNTKERDAAAGGQGFANTWKFFNENDPSQAFHRLNSSLDAMKIAIGDAVLPLIVRLANVIAPVASAVAKWASQNAKLVATLAIAGLLAGLVVGITMVVVGIWMMVAAAIALDVAFAPIIIIVLIVVVAIAALIAIGVLLYTHWHQISAFLTGTFHAALSAIGAAFSALGSKVHSFIDSVLSAVTSFFADLLKKVEEGWSQFTQRPVYWIGFLLAYIPAKLAELYVRFTAWIAQMIIRAAEWAAQMAFHALQAGNQFAANIYAYLSQLPGRVGGYLWAVLQQLPGWVAQFVQWAWNGANQFLDAINRALAKAPGEMVQIGKNIAQGIINGITSMISAGEGAIGSFVHGLIAGANAAGQGQSPYRLFAKQVGEIGIAGGIAMGIRQGMSAPLNAVTEVVKESSTVASNETTTTMTPASQSNQDIQRSNQLLQELKVLIQQMNSNIALIAHDQPSLTPMAQRLG